MTDISHYYVIMCSATILFAVIKIQLFCVGFSSLILYSVCMDLFIICGLDLNDKYLYLSLMFLALGFKKNKSQVIKYPISNLLNILKKQNGNSSKYHLLEVMAVFWT